MIITCKQWRWLPSLGEFTWRDGFPARTPTPIRNWWICDKVEDEYICSAQYGFAEDVVRGYFDCLSYFCAIAIARAIAITAAIAIVRTIAIAIGIAIVIAIAIAIAVAIVIAIAIATAIAIRTVGPSTQFFN